MVGGRGDKTGNRTWNRATNTKRQPGSTFKIIGCFAPALDGGGLTLASVQDDAPFTVGSKTFHNYDNSYRGFTNIRTAITYSINIVTVKTLQQIGADLAYQYAEDFGITTLTEEDKNLSLALGGLTKGVTNLELTGAYATIANGGKYLEPKFYSKVLDHDGKEATAMRSLSTTREWPPLAAAREGPHAATQTRRTQNKQTKFSKLNIRFIGYISHMELWLPQWTFPP